MKHSRCELDKLRSLIESTVMINELTNQACIKPDIDENLLELNDQITRLKTKADAALASVSTEVDTDTIKLDSNTETGFFFRVTLKVIFLNEMFFIDRLFMLSVGEAHSSCKSEDFDYD